MIRTVARSTHAPRGVALPLVLQVVAVVLVIAFAIGNLGIQQSNLVHANAYSHQALFAAHAGIADATRRLVENAAWSTGISDTAFGSDGTLRYSVQVTNNLGGGATVRASDGAVVGPGAAYLQARGTCRGAYARRVSVLLRTGPGGPRYRYALATGGGASLNPAGTVCGSIKASDDLVLGGRLQVVPNLGSGSVLVGGDVSVQSNVVAEQDVRARGTISNPQRISGTAGLYPADATTATLPFINDGRTVNVLYPGEQGEVLPNPDLDRLLAPGAFVEHAGVTMIKGTFDLGGQIHYFPDGITFSQGAKLVGAGTIVARGNASFNCPIGITGNPLPVNILAIDGIDTHGTVGGSTLSFGPAVYIRGLLYSHGSITTQGAVDVEGTVIAYRPSANGYAINANAQANFHIDLAPLAVPCPGLEAWLGWESADPSDRLTVVAVQRW